MPATQSLPVSHTRWAIVLPADEPPNQSALLNRQSLLRQTLRRVGPLVPPRRTKVVITRQNQSFTRQPDPGGSQFILQPGKRGTAPAILYALLSIDAEDPCSTVALFPADQHYSDEAALTRTVDLAFRISDLRPGLITLLGVVPASADPCLGWIEPGEPLPDLPESSLRRVRRFQEKPPLSVARELLATGSLWNTFVLVGCVQTLLHLVANTLPDLYDSFEPVEREIGTAGESRAAEAVYHNIASVDFSRRVLEPNPHELCVLPMTNSGWTRSSFPV